MAISTRRLERIRIRVREGESIMKRLSMIAAGLLTLGLTAARAETAGKSKTTVEVVPPTAPTTDANGNTRTPSDVDVNPNPNPTPGSTENKVVSPSPAVPGTNEPLPPP